MLDLGSLPQFQSTVIHNAKEIMKDTKQRVVTKAQQNLLIDISFKPVF